MIDGKIENKAYFKYAKDVIDGKVIACKYIKNACKRFLSDLERDDLVFHVALADDVIRFVGIMKHDTGKFAGKPFKLLSWQQFVVANIYGFYWIEDETRRFTTAYIEIARKNGKTQLAAALGLYALLGEGERGTQVIAAANSKDQASILLNAATSLSKSIDAKHKYLSPFKSEIRLQKTNSFLKIVSADTSKLDGLNCSTFIIDEYHEAKDTKMWDVLKSSQGMRTNPLGIIITTAGFDKTSPCYEKRSVGIEVVSGVKTEDTFFCAIYTLDDEDDWTDSSVWSKCCPCLGITVSKKYMESQIESAKNSPREEVGVKTKNCNIWCSSYSVWIPDQYIVEATQNVDLGAFKGFPCYVGVDLAATSDFTAVAYMVVRDGIYYFKVCYYLPESALYEKSDKELYKYWRQRDLLTVTEGNVTDYDYITNDMMKYKESLLIQCVAYDKYNATQWAIDATSKGLPLKEYSQTLCNFNIPTREFERLIKSGKVVIDNNEMNRFCLRNVSLKSDHNGNVKPNKAIDKKKIDGVIAMLQALGIYLSEPHYSNTI